jgi:hypothetical protein
MVLDAAEETRVREIIVEELNARKMFKNRATCPTEE